MLLHLATSLGAYAQARDGMVWDSSVMLGVAPLLLRLN